MPRYAKIPQENWQRAREMRKNLTKSERVLWKALRSRQLKVRFLRQHPVGPYIADFYTYEKKLVIEVDGDAHALPEQLAHDRGRDAYFESLGFRVKRYTNNDILVNLDGVLKDIMEVLHGSSD
ncbi:MAG: endonuclease domain-containing protein [bacterium]